jgi:hypothetical protein
MPRLALTVAELTARLYPGATSLNAALSDLNSLAVMASLGVPASVSVLFGSDRKRFTTCYGRSVGCQFRQCRVELCAATGGVDVLFATE